MTDRQVVICDLDGTLVDVRAALHHVQNRPKDWDAFYTYTSTEAPPIAAVAALIRAMRLPVIVSTGRPYRFLPQTSDWLRRHHVGPIEGIRMREDHDRSHATDVKREALLRLEYDVVLAIDDDPDVCAMYRANGVLTLQVLRITPQPS